MSWEPLFDALTNRYPRAEIERLPGQASEVHLLAEAAAEHRALSESCAVVVTPLMWPIVIEGRDAVDYLHRRMSQDLKAIPENHGAWALQLDGGGRIEMEMLLYRAGGALWGLVERQFAEIAIGLIEKYVFEEEIAVHAQWQAEGVVAFAGPKAAEALRSALVEADWIEEPWAARLEVELKIEGAAPQACRVFRDCRWPVPYYQIMAPLPALPGLVLALEKLAEKFGGGVVGARAHEYFRIEQGVTRFGRDTGDGVIPLEAGLAAALSFDKGCYPGQEVIARMNNLGHPARLLAALRWPTSEFSNATSVKPGADLVYAQAGGELSGTVTSVAVLPGLDQAVGLGYVRWARRHAENIGVVVENAEGGGFIATSMRVLHDPHSGGNPCATGEESGKTLNAIDKVP